MGVVEGSGGGSAGVVAGHSLPEDQVIIEGVLRFSPVLGLMQRDDRWVARLANTVETPEGRLVTIELRGDRADVAERVLTMGCRIRASGRWSGRRFDIDRFDTDSAAEPADHQRRYRLTRPAGQATAATSDQPASVQAPHVQPEPHSEPGRGRPAGQRRRPGPSLGRRGMDRGPVDDPAGENDTSEQDGATQPTAGRSGQRVHGRRPDDDGVIRL
jgi:hypothetical protein